MISYIRNNTYKQVEFVREPLEGSERNSRHLKLQRRTGALNLEYETKLDKTKVLKQLKNMNEERKLKLYNILEKYKNSMTSKPGKCNLFTYKFQGETDKPIVGYSRPIPFALRAEVQQQIEQMIKDGIIEISNSHMLNPLTIVPREGKKPRICVDARKVNQCMIPDRERAPPIHEILQKFEGVQYIYR
jgi:hypothetical protein